MTKKLIGVVMFALLFACFGEQFVGPIRGCFG